MQSLVLAMQLQPQIVWDVHCDAQITTQVLLQISEPAKWDTMDTVAKITASSFFIFKFYCV